MYHKEYEKICYMRADFTIVKYVTDYDHDGNVIGPAMCEPYMLGLLGKDGPCERYTPEYIRIRTWAYVMIAIYAGLVPLTFLYSLLKVRKTLLAELETPLSRALQFLHRPYKPQFWYFEIIEIARKLTLVGFAVVVEPGSLLQLIFALMVAISVIAIEVQSQPFRHVVDSYCSLIAALACIFILLMCIVLRTTTLVQAIKSTEASGYLVLQKSLWSFLDFDLSLTLGVLFSASIAVFGTVLFFMQRAARSAKTMPRVRHRSGHEAQLRRLVDTSELHERWHIFLSHVWMTGQDQVRVIKQLLKEVLPGVRVFLDVDDLADISRLEEEINASQAICVFVSRGYFESKNCLRELVSGLDREREQKKGRRRSSLFGRTTARDSVFFVCESERDKGAITESMAMAELDSSYRKGVSKWNAHVQALIKAERNDLEPPLWEGWPLPYRRSRADVERFRWIKESVRAKMAQGAIMWYRVHAYQQVSLLQIASHLIKIEKNDPPYIPGGPLAEKVPLPTAPSLDGFHVYVSANNPGAVEFVYDELRHQFDGHLSIAYSTASIRDFHSARERAQQEFEKVQTEERTRRGSIVGAMGGGFGEAAKRRSMSTPQLIFRQATSEKLLRKDLRVDATDRKKFLTRGKAKSSSSLLGGLLTSREATDKANTGWQVAGQGEAAGGCVFLLYLDRRTWTSPHAGDLAAEVEAQLLAAKANDVPHGVMLLHERDQFSPFRHPAEFSHFFDTTPPELIKLGLYQQIAIPLYDGLHRTRCMRDAAITMSKMFDEASLISPERWRIGALAGSVLGGNANGMNGVGGGGGADGGAYPFGHGSADGMLFATAEGHLTTIAPRKNAAGMVLRGCLNFDMIKGVDDDSNTVQISPALYLELKGGAADKGGDVDANGEQRKRGGFTQDDVGHRVTIDTKKRRVIINGVERRMRWSRHVQRADSTMVEGKEWRRKMGFGMEWTEWKPPDVQNAEILRVESEVGGVVRLSRAETGANNASAAAAAGGGANMRASVSIKSDTLTFDNPEAAGARLGVLDLGVGTFEGKGKARVVVRTKDRIGDELVSVGANIEEKPSELNGSRSDFAQRELVRLPGEIPPTTIQAIRSARHLWRSKTSALLDNPGAVQQKGGGGVGRKENTLDISFVEKSKADLIRGMAGKLRMNVGTGGGGSSGALSSRDHGALRNTSAGGAATKPESAVSHPPPPAKLVTKQTLKHMRDLRHLTCATAALSASAKASAALGAGLGLESNGDDEELAEESTVGELGGGVGGGRTNTRGKGLLQRETSGGAGGGDRASRLQAMRTRIGGGTGGGGTMRSTTRGTTRAPLPGVPGGGLLSRRSRSRKEPTGSSSSLADRNSSRMDAQIQGEIKERPGRQVTRNRGAAQGELHQMLTRRGSSAKKVTGGGGVGGGGGAPSKLERKQSSGRNMLFRRSSSKDVSPPPPGPGGGGPPQKQGTIGNFFTGRKSRKFGEEEEEDDDGDANA